MHDCLIIGAGQFGIACADKLERPGVSDLIVGDGASGRQIALELAESGRRVVLARIMRKRDPIPAASCSDRILAACGVRLMPRAADADGRAFVFADGGRIEADAVIWSGDCEERMDWIALPGFRSERDLSAGYGRTPEPGFCVVGRRWLTTRASELVLGVERAAERIVAEVRARLNTLATAVAFESAAHDAR